MSYLSCRRLQSALVFALFTMALSSCGDTSGPGAVPDENKDYGEPVDGDWLVYRLPAEPATLNPYLSAAASYAVQVVDGNIFEALYARDNETVELVPELATGSKVSDDHLTYTFYLREDAFFSDGVPLTAKDVKFTFDAILDPKNDTPDMRSFLTDIESVEAIDDYTVQIKVSKPYFLNLTILSGIFVLPEHVYGKGDFNTIAANRNPVGSGPYVFESWETGGQLMLAKSDTYWGEEKRHVEKLVYRVITDDNAAFQALKSGEIDVSRISPEQYELDTSKPSFQKNFYVEKTFSPVDGYFGGLTYMGWNTRRPKFSDKRVRRALTMLVDRDTLLEKVWRGLGRVATGYHSRDAKESNPDIVKIPFDPDGAAKLLEEAGWVDTNNDGVRDKDGIEFKYEFIYSSGINEYEILATTYKENLTKAGIEVTLRPLEFATLIESVQERTFDSFVAGWSLTYESDPYQLWHTSQSEQGSNYTGFGNAETDKLIEDARLEFDRDKRVTLYRRLHQILHDEQPYTFLFNRQRVVAASKRFQNVTMYKQGFDILEWWVPVELQKYH